MSDMDTTASNETASNEAVRLQSAIDAMVAGASLEDVARSLGGDDEAIELAALAAATERACHVKAPAAMRARQQVALQAEFERQREHRHTVGAGRGRSPGYRWLGIRFSAGLLAIALATGSAVVVSADSLPGEVLYPVKLAAEGARVALSGNAHARAALRLELAGERWSEIRRLVDLGIMPSPELIDAMLETLALSARDAELSGDADLIEFARTELERHRDALRGLAEETDPATRRMIQAALGDADDPLGNSGGEPPVGSSAGDPPRTDRGASGLGGGVTATPSASAPGGSESDDPTPASSPTASPEPSPTPTDEPSPTPTQTSTPTEPPPGGAGGPPVAPPPAEPPAEPTTAPPDEPGETPVPDNPRATERAREEPTPPPGFPTRRRP